MAADKQKIIFISGASSGFGRAMAEMLATKGYKVYGTSRNVGMALDGLYLLPMDVTSRESVQSAVEQLVEKEGRIDVLISNAGIGLAGGLEDFGEEESLKELNTNFLGAHRMCSAVVPYMRRQGHGKIIVIGSVAGLMGLPFQGFYSASKFALEGYVQALRYELTPWDIKVVMINPGDFSTGFTANRRLVKKAESGVYSNRLKKTLEVIVKDETGGMNPLVLAKKIVAIVEKKNPAHNYVVASFEQRLAVLLSKFLPSKLFFRMLGQHYRVLE